VVYLWEAPYAFPELRHRLRLQAETVDDLVEAFEREGLAEARRVAALGVAVAQAEGWAAQPLVEQCYGGVGYQFARLAEHDDTAMVVVGERGSSGLKGRLGSASDVVAHMSPVPVLVVPHPLTTREWAAAAEGPVLVGHDGSNRDSEALVQASELFVGRHSIQAHVESRTEDGERDSSGIVHLHRHGYGAPGAATALSDYARQHHAGVIVIGSSGRSTGPTRLLGDLAKEVTHQAHRPVLIVPTGERVK
jgi:nucleotide-binding universal stress UspA family protein